MVRVYTPLSGPDGSLLRRKKNPTTAKGGWGNAVCLGGRGDDYPEISKQEVHAARRHLLAVS